MIQIPKRRPFVHCLFCWSFIYLCVVKGWKIQLLCIYKCGPYSNAKVSKTCNYRGIKTSVFEWLAICHGTLLADLIFSGFEGGGEVGGRGDGDSGGGGGVGGSGGCGSAVQMKKSDL